MGKDYFPNRFFRFPAVPGFLTLRPLHCGDVGRQPLTKEEGEAWFEIRPQVGNEEQGTGVPIGIFCIRLFNRAPVQIAGIRDTLKIKEVREQPPQYDHTVKKCPP